MPQVVQFYKIFSLFLIKGFVVKVHKDPGLQPPKCLFKHDKTLNMMTIGKMTKLSVACTINIL